tara:strand:+ start:20638 stop:20952 length:315 start_codon:yes stop_codon:yes gene_type:complete
MKNRTKFMELSKLNMGDLIIARMHCTQRIAMFGSLNRAAVALLGIVIGQLGKTIYAAEVLAWLDYVSLGLALYCVMAYLLFNGVLARATALKEAISELIALQKQ